MTPREAVLEAIRHREVRPVPCSIPVEETVKQKLEEHFGTPDWQDRIPRYIRHVGAVDTFAREKIDDTWSRDFYGGLWRMDCRPEHLQEWPLKEPTFEGYDFPPPERFFRPDWKEQSRTVCEEQDDAFLCAELSWGLFEISWKMRGFENVMSDCVLEPGFYGELLDKIMDLYLAFTDYVSDLPVQAIKYGDDWGDQRGIILGPDRWREFLKPRWAKIFQRCHEAGKIAICHSCGSVVDIMDDIIEIELDVLESCQPEAHGMDPYELKKRWGDKITFWGCLGSQSTMPFGTLDEIRAEAGKLCREMGKGGGYILAPAKPLQPETPVENALALIEAAAQP